MNALTDRMAGRLELWPVNRLVAYEFNAKTHPDDQIDQIAASIAEFGFNAPILVDESDGTIIAGHGRLMAAHRLGLKEVPVIPLGHMSEAQRRAYILADNKISENGGWDEALLAHELAAIDASGMHVECSTVKRFAPSGVTAVWILSESHFTVHTYPEHAYLSVDCYTCGTEGDPGAAIAALRDLLSIDRLRYSLNPRGVLPERMRGPRSCPASVAEA